MKLFIKIARFIASVQANGPEPENSVIIIGLLPYDEAKVAIVLFFPSGELALAS